MAKTKGWALLAIVLFQNFKTILQDTTQYSTLDWNGQELGNEQNVGYNKDIANSKTPEIIISKKNEIEHQSIKSDQFPTRNPLSTSSDLLTSQFEEQCLNIGSQPCTCYYPDHPDVIKFELSTDDITLNASDVNGTGPANCKDLQILGHSLNGIYLVRFNNKRTRTIYCEFKHMAEEYYKDSKTEEIISYNRRGNNLESSKKLRFCGNVRINFTGCTFLYPENPDAPKFELKKNMKNSTEKSVNSNRGVPNSCSDLRAIGYTMKGFFLVWLNTVKIKTIYCDFSQTILEDVNKVNVKSSTSKNKSRFCSNIGSPPCSCSYPNFPNILQLELSNDELTRRATAENGIGPASCNDLESIGYNLNGFYMIRAKEKTITTFFCKFGQNNKIITTVKPGIRQRITEPSNQNENVLYRSLESQIKTPKSAHDTIEQLATTELTLIPFVFSTQTRLDMNGNLLNPTFLLSTRPFETPTSMPSKQIIETKRTELPSNPEIVQLTTVRPAVNLNQKIFLYHQFGRSYPLMNEYGKCLAVEMTGTIKPSENGAKIIQADCDPLEKGQLWKWDRIENRLCNDWAKCLSLPFDHPEGKTSELFQWDIIDREKSQIWIALSENQFLNIMGWCLAFEENSDSHEVRAKTDYCNDQEKGQIWSFAWFENDQEFSQSEFKVETTTTLAQSGIIKIENNQLKTDMEKRNDINTKSENVQLTTAHPAVQLSQKIHLYHQSKRSYPLMNNHGKCLAVETTGTIEVSKNGAKIIQADCDPSEKGQLWKWDREKTLLCNDWNKCLSVPFDLTEGLTKDVFHWDIINDEKRQQWVALSTNQFLNLGSCLAFEDDSDAHGIRAITEYCKAGDKGQIWTFAWY